ncbi:Cys-tRNA(Pro)/Cys-tRNA(Cys) deacylase [Weissella uvarum]|uniref:aminoacyl-tRNA deacylase n=1 Tax=Weissella uvarum TaxID=1479233 RepID=UPI00195F4250|nr:aminoacyl-tRNA deacylase [Weissella uvarum]MBM7616861.1 Cys-tRNA(Pro)/Cys-tRNA(Cys) deacylase [Weissella uvarum]MCM0594687.1 aminoacyl-tRNA deacylase [Weissella uvarum]
MSKKNKIKKILVEQILDKAGIPYESIVFQDGLHRQATEMEQYQLTEHDIYKTLALTGNVSGPVIGIVPIDQHLDEKKLAVASGNKKVSMLPTKELQKTTGYVHGANNPVGIWQNKKFPIYIDEAAQHADQITVSAGELGRSIRLNPEELCQFVHGTFADIVQA